jgi:outer membrane murein-binding lipoprotein Lpp
MNRMSKRLCTGLILGVLALGVAGCGSSAKVEANSTSVGQELQDLEEARDKGLITESEYQKQRNRILNRK